MSAIRHRLLGLCATPAAFCLLDACLTLAGQSQAYWRGTYSQVNEISPTFHHLLVWHPVAFLVSIAVWIGIFGSLIFLVPETLALIVSIAVTIGHLMGAETWLMWRFKYSYQLCLGLIVLAAVSLGVGIRWFCAAQPREEHCKSMLPAAIRWALAVVLIAVAIWLFLWPRTI